MDAGSTIRIRQVGNGAGAYVFAVDFGGARPELMTDEALPIGGDTGPVPEQLLISGVANCLCASLVFALGKFRQDAQGVEAEATCQVERNPEGRLRITGIDVRIRLGAAAAEMPRIDRVLEQFERFCTVSESVKAGIPVSVSLADGCGTRLK
ncbi:OsmC family protein [Methylobacterium sp. NEAU K]|uniref:OsmC family protein n=1 Tax=Methylobacterium sp. NEAU K TaxID=3064946 RepID=UPI0027332B83|nr:OsmC family protein [Methylobacterium sp. NEAU K]MDP4003243.1 OsmC family protein [Methylobacterium sp. NEAU K]